MYVISWINEYFLNIKKIYLLWVKLNSTLDLLWKILPHVKCDVNRTLSLLAWDANQHSSIDLKLLESNITQTYVRSSIIPSRCYKFGRTKLYILYSPRRRYNDRYSHILLFIPVEERPFCHAGVMKWKKGYQSNIYDNLYLNLIQNANWLITF